MRYAVVIEKAEGNYSAYVQDLPGCAATGVVASNRQPGAHAARRRSCVFMGEPPRLSQTPRRRGCRPPLSPTVAGPCPVSASRARTASDVWATTGTFPPDPDARPLAVDVLTGDVWKCKVETVGADRVAVDGKAVPGDHPGVSPRVPADVVLLARPLLQTS